MDNSSSAETTPQAVPHPKLKRPPLSWKVKLGLILFGALAALVMLEVFLRSVGFVYHFERRHKPGDYPEDAFVILCLGDSCTYGQGAKDEYGQSYPAQLENLLRSRHGDKYHVANLGMAGMNSSQLARRFEGYVRLHRPDLAIILVGNNDVWNQNESYIYLVGEGRKAKFTRKLRARLRAWGDSLRVVRLARMIALNIDDDRYEHHDREEDRRRDDDHYNPMEDTQPSSSKFERGEAILGDIARIEDLYRFNFERMTNVADRYGVELLWLDYHLGAKFGETKYIAPILEDLDAPSLDLFPYFHKGDVTKDVLRFDDTVRKELIALDRWHPNELGYAVFARAIYNKLVEMGHAEGPPIEVLDNIQVHEPNDRVEISG